MHSWYINSMRFHSKYALATFQCEWWAAANRQTKSFTTEAQAIDQMLLSISSLAFKISRFLWTKLFCHDELAQFQLNLTTPIYKLLYPCVNGPNCEIVEHLVCSHFNSLFLHQWRDMTECMIVLMKQVNWRISSMATGSSTVRRGSNMVYGLASDIAGCIHSNNSIAHSELTFPHCDKIWFVSPRSMCKQSL